MLSKVSAPSVRAGLVDRPRVTGTLLESRDFPVVLLSAPPGYGKTTALTLWREADPRPFAWATLDDSDNDPVALVRTMFAALSRVLPLGNRLPVALTRPDPPLDDVVLPDLLNACVVAESPCVLVLDDLHRVRAHQCISAIEYVVDHLPDGFQVALATRSDPALPLARMRMHGRLAELRSADLAYDAAEAAAVLTAAGIDLPTESVAQLVERTEGWPAGMYLAALSLRGHDDPEGFVERFAGTSRHVADLLSEDVLARQSDTLRDFLLRTCILDELTAPLCGTVASCDDASDLLLALEHSNLFVVPLDKERRVYRYHHLFAQYLRAELARRTPELVPDLHRRASRWYRERGLVQRAIVHALAGGDDEAAARMVVAACRDLAEHGDVETLRRWVAPFDHAFAQRSQVMVNRPCIRSHLSSVVMHAVHARVLAGRGDLDAAGYALEGAPSPHPRPATNSWRLMIETRVLLAPALVELGMIDEALALLDEVDVLVSAFPDCGPLPSWAGEAERLVGGRRRRLGENRELSDAERRILRLLATDLTLREIGRELCLSLNTVKTHTHAIYRKLGVSSRAEAVAAGRRATRLRSAPGTSPG